MGQGPPYEALSPVNWWGKVHPTTRFACVGPASGSLFSCEGNAVADGDEDEVDAVVFDDVLVEVVDGVVGFGLGIEDAPLP